jgi:hypothetical protein
MNTCAVYVKLEHGIVLEHEKTVVVLPCGVSEGLDRATVEDWLKQHAEISAIKTGAVCIVEPVPVPQENN